jgi:poly-gamma-glutamate synthesis protein (capsule biosynthesis protein)
VPRNLVPPAPILLVTNFAKLVPAVAAVFGSAAVLAGALETSSGEASHSARGPLGSGSSVLFAFGGDVHFEGILATKLATAPPRLLDRIAPVLGQADIAVVNLETAVTTRGTAASKDYVFRAPPNAFAALRSGNVDVASMANNHGLDYGEVGLRDSLAAAKRYRFPVIGIGLDARRAYAPYRTTVRGQRIAILGATQVLDDHLIEAWTAGPRKPGLASAKDVPRLLQEVRRARRAADTVVVFLHWGRELERCPTKDQRTLARQLVKAGADIVVGGHAHRLLGAGRMATAFVSYGLGNFVWYGTSELSVRTGVLLVSATGRHVDSYRWVPARITDGVPAPLGGVERQRELASWRALRRCTGLAP